MELDHVLIATEAAESAFGSWVAGGEIPRLLGWCVRTDELDSVAGRLGLTIADGSRTRADGTVLRWRMAGIEQAREEPSLPFFIEWGPGTPYPGDAPVQHRIGAPKIDELRIEGDPNRLEHWLGGAQLPVAIRKGTPALRSLMLRAEGAQVVLNPSL